MGEAHDVSGADIEAPAPLAPPEVVLLHQLAGLPERTPEQHSELEELHARATAYVEQWQADHEGAFDRMRLLTEGLAHAFSYMVAAVPALAGLGGLVARLQADAAAVREMVVPPPPPPELPPAPEPPLPPVEEPQPDHTAVEASNFADPPPAPMPNPPPEPQPAPFPADAPQPDHTAEENAH